MRTKSVYGLAIIFGRCLIVSGIVITIILSFATLKGTASNIPIWRLGVSWFLFSVFLFLIPLILGAVFRVLGALKKWKRSNPGTEMNGEE